MNVLRCYKGQSIVEISLITPLLLVALYVPADFGISFFVAHLTQNAVREGARVGVATKEPFDQAAANSIKSYVLANLPARLTSPNVTVKYYKDADPSPPNPSLNRCMQSVEVTVQGSYDLFLYQIIRILGFDAPDSIQITRTSRMRYEFQPYFWGSGGSGPCPGPPAVTSA